ncbi:MAG: ergothioneine biosynthesis protein EgtB [Steroidobacteraceae bacterium]
MALTGPTRLPPPKVATQAPAAEAPTLAEQYRQMRETTVALCAPLAAEDYVVQSMPDASPAKWHLAHTTWFFEEFVLQQAGPTYEFHDADFRYLFNSYYNAVGPMHGRSSRGLLSRPTVQQVLEYRAHVDERMGALLHAGSGVPAKLAGVITLGLHHEQQHQELLLTDVKHLFSCNPLLPAYIRQSPPTSRAAPALSFRRFDGGLVDIGHPGRDGPAGTGFCFDNELPRHRVFAAAFGLATRPATNAEYLEFIHDGGYRNAAHWLSDGWATVQQEKWSRPIYWSQSLAEEFTLNGGLRELDPHAPVCHLSCYEADAFARWAGGRLPTEFEWEIAAAAASPSGNFLESRHWHPITAAHSAPSTRPAPASQSDSLTLLQMFGDVWEWTRSAYAPYPGYRAASGALGEYNGKFMVNQLVLRGGSCATPRSHIRPTYRNFFNPAARWQFSGVRLARDL